MEAVGDREFHPPISHPRGVLCSLLSDASGRARENPIVSVHAHARTRKDRSLHGPRFLGQLLRVASSPEGIAILCLLGSLVVLRPFGNYAVDDEWAYLRSLQHLHTEGKIKILDWNPMSLVGLLLWALPFTKVLGFSFTAARISTVTLFGILCLAVLTLLRHWGVSRRTATMAGLLLIFHPLVFFHGFLYVTDVPAMAWTMLAVLLLLKGLEGETTAHRGMLVAGAAVGAFGFLVRQSGALVHLALLGYLALFDRRRLRSADGVVAALVLPAVTIGLFQHWYTTVHGPTQMYRQMTRQIIQTLVHPAAAEFIGAAFRHAMYLGLFVLPLAASLPWRRCGKLGMARGSAWVLVTGFCAIGVLYMGMAEGVVFPYLPNKITHFGYLNPNELIVGDREVLWTRTVGCALSVAGVLAVAGFAAAALRKGRPEPRRGRVLNLLVLLGLLQFLYTLTTYPIVFDRHLLLCFPTVLVLLCVWTRAWPAKRLAFALILTPLVGYSLAGTHDVHAFSRAAFQAGDSLIARRASPRAIDGGYAFDGWHMYEESRWERVIRARPTDPWWVWSLIPAIEPRLVISLSPTLNGDQRREDLSPGAPRTPQLAGYRLLETWPYETWWPPRQRLLYVLVRE